MCYFCSALNSDLYSSNADLSIGQILIGGTDNDMMIGTDGFDKIYGQAGDDTIDGGLGDDYLRGNDGADQFVLRRGNGRDTIFDFEDNKDKFLLKDGLQYEDLTISQQYGRTVISVTDTGEVLANLLYEVDVSQIEREDFVVFSEEIKYNIINDHNQSQSILLEVENFNLDGYEPEENNKVSGGQLAKLNSQVSHGIATTEFNGLPGFYDIIVGYFDENDGAATLQLEVNDTTVDSWILDESLLGAAANANTFRTRIIEDVQLNPSDLISVVGIRERAEFARVDYIELIANAPTEVGLGVGAQL
ncbi:Hemolysin-type calcium-binding region [Gloeothece citriformis PCC 7424]|uniref:Hemolysin-type calcium-binding region n=1 Tax=Gloeothece citriformis (strain PCC 7424) TaxID=65393 RepID=B7KGQ3_GLOC7|nr:hemolysin-type calcium-binding protein [Gloeothece citriformis]ACK71980.1 Hemolysin-type calcium-binding region [Gloeothece citriformis PCC 7424]